MPCQSRVYGRRDTSNINKAQSPAATFNCSICAKYLPRSAFAKAELARGGSSRCRDCSNRSQCGGCRLWLLPAQLGAKSKCLKCQENAQVDRFLQTPKDEVTHFGVERALQLDRDAEHELLLACHKCGLSERMVLQNILDFLRVPYVTTKNALHFCDLCDETFRELAVVQGQTVHMAAPVKDWTGCPDPRLAFDLGEAYTIAELIKSSQDRWFFRTLTMPRKRAISRSEPKRVVTTTDNKFSPPDRHDGSPVLGVLPTFESFWAPIDATEEGRLVSPLMKHLSGSGHKAHEAAVAAGDKLLVSRAAIKLAKNLGNEGSAVSLSRFRDGLGLAGRFCEPKDVELARKLERVRDIEIPVKFLRTIFPQRQQFLWISPDEFWEAESKYEQRQKQGTRKGS
eukprot:TRINITY_DN88477_c0_g1_i1.p1 TRINITY_DN88477_c0_g1~~TRINITY_DN88477_c0_g1_i1.p1  ORF type:complete len:397 (-),score=45.87 TRINITY_DN88477_c0_g1_i1:114-1304(-)